MNELHKWSLQGVAPKNLIIRGPCILSPSSLPQRGTPLRQGSLRVVKMSIIAASMPLNGSFQE